jgi:Flp pilus assembly protein TadD
VSDRIDEYLAKVAARPSDTLTRYVLAKEYFDRGDHERAVEQFRLLVAAKGDWMKCWIHLGQSLSALGRSGEARAALAEALRLAHAQNHTGPAGEIQALLDTLA